MLRDSMSLDVKQRHKLHTAVMVYKVKYYLAPPYMTKLLSNVSKVNSYNTRAGLSGALSVPNASLNLSVPNASPKTQQTELSL